MNIKQQLLDHALDLQLAGQDLERLIESFTESGFRWDEVTEVQASILLELKPMRFFNGKLEIGEVVIEAQQ